MADKQVMKGIVLRETDTKESDKILTVLTGEHGKISVIARGARRKRSRIAAASQLLAYSEMVVYEQRGWYLLDEAATLSLFDGVRRDVTLLSLASYFAELTESVTAEDVPAEEILPLLLNALYALDTAHKPQWQVKAAFELKLLAFAGYEPLLDACAACGGEPSDPAALDAREGVLFCGNCAEANTLPLRGGTLSAMRYILHSEPKKMLAFRLDEPKDLCTACERFAAVQLDRGFRTLDFYRAMQTE